MALSKQQKEFLNLLTTEPEKAKSLLIGNTPFINSFKNQFLLDGTSLLHILLDCSLEFISMNKNISDSNNKPFDYSELLFYVLNNSNLSISDKKDNQKDSSYDIFLTKTHLLKNFESFDIELQYEITDFYFNLVFNEGSKCQSHIYINTLNFLLTHHYYDYYEKLISVSIDSSNIYNQKTIIKSLILSDNVNYLKQFFNKFPQSLENISTYSFPENLYPNEVSNLITYAIRNKSFSIAEYLIKENLLSLDGKITISNYTSNPYSYKDNGITKSAVFPLAEAIHQKNKQLYTILLDKMTSEQLLTVLSSSEKTTGFNINHKLYLSLIVNNEDDFYFKNLLPYLNELKNSNNQSAKIIFFNTILSSENFSKIKVMLNEFFPIELLTKEDKNPVLNCVWNSLIKTKNSIDSILTDEELHDIIDIYKKLDQIDCALFTHETLFNSVLLKFPKLLKSLVLNGLDLNEHTYDKQYNSKSSLELLSFLVKDKNFIKDVKNNPDLYKESLTFIYEQTISKKILLDENKPSNLLNDIIKSNVPLFFDLLHRDDVISQKMLNNIIEPLKYCHFDFFNHIGLKLLDFNFDIFNSKVYQNGSNQQNIIPFYFYLNFSNVQTIEYILSKHNPNNLSIATLSEEPLFWDYLGDEDVWNFVIQNGATLNSTLVSNFMIRQSQNAYQYFSHGGICPNDFNLFDCSKHDSLIKESSLLLTFFPSVAGIVNEQNRYAVSYSIPKLDNLIKSQNSLNSDYITQNKLYKNMLLHFQSGYLHQNKKALSQLKTSLKKYPSIMNKCPDLIAILNYSLLDATLNKKETVKKHKL